MSFVFANLIDLLTSLNFIAIIVLHTFERFNHLHVLRLLLFLFFPFCIYLLLLEHQLLGSNRQFLRLFVTAIADTDLFVLLRCLRLSWNFNLFNWLQH